MDLSQELSQLRAEFDGLSRDSQELDSRTDKTLPKTARKPLALAMGMNGLKLS